jgi:lipoate-protein ligase A
MSKKNQIIKKYPISPLPTFTVHRSRKTSPSPYLTKVVYSTSYDPWFNLALEESLLNQLAPHEIILYLWQNQTTVVIGRNQNAWKECAWEQLEKNGGKLARRLSGGGAVFHDLGNLNFTFILRQEYYDLEKQLSVIFEALKINNIQAEFSGRNDLLLKGKKFSGHAYYFRNQAALHHGTILVHSDLNSLNLYLKPSPKKMLSKGIDSVRSRVVNLSSLNKNITIKQIRESLEKSFASSYGHPDSFITYGEADKSNFLKLYEKYSSWEWRFGASPRFDFSLCEHFPWGEIEIGFQLKNGIISACTLYSDAMDETLIRTIAQCFLGLPLNKQNLIKALSSLQNTENEYLINDLSSFISQEQSL